MQPIEELETAARRAREAVQAALGEAERSPLTRQIESYARAEALLFAHALIAEIARRLAAGAPAPSALGPLLADALEAVVRSHLTAAV